MTYETNNAPVYQARRLDVVMLAVYLLGGQNKSVDTEDVAIRSDELVPGIFSWRKYPEQINFELVRVTLSNAKKPHNNKLLTGSGRAGWRLSTNGLDWIELQGKKLLKRDVNWSVEKSKAGSVDVQRLQREKKRLQLSPAWKSWSSGEAVSIREARELFRIDEYSTGKMLEIKVVRLQSLFNDDPAIGCFLKVAGSLVRETGEG